MGHEWASSPRGLTVLEAAGPSEHGVNSTRLTQEVVRVVVAALRVRQRSWCVRVVVVSRDPTFLLFFAESSLQHRLLLWSTRLLVLTDVQDHEVRHLLRANWTFSMMNTVFLSLKNDPENLR